ncbi:ABC transporter ATP-binding protein [Paenibacillus polymyxa]|uniref:ABC transporter ATP-binding protein n=1 Tax=Paenibacillus TaxID=44249 RepID=UPI0008FC4F90|nr:ATP-binding cassette domain-containing protein [Paenibacillus polymyxa]APB72881.1 ABC transporter ATP-binding protein [Paenibacillus polymyxa]
MNEYIIETNSLSKIYKGRAAVNQLDLKIARGDIYGFLGPNGAGKTTTIRMLLGLIRPTRGTIRIFGKDIRRHKLDILRKVGSLVEYPSYYGHLNAIENLEAIRRILNVPKQNIAEVLEVVRLTKHAKRPVKGYSLGMKQRLGIAAALLGNPEVLILDEPTNGLDPEGIQEMRTLIQAMPKQRGITVLVSSHLLSEVEHMANTVGIIREGELVFQNTIHNLRQESAGGIRVVVSEPEAAQLIAREQGYHSVKDGSALDFENMNDAAVALLVRRLVENTHAVYRVEERRKSLEDMFMQVVGKGGTSL